jgi:hypothetical protein
MDNVKEWILHFFKEDKKHISFDSLLFVVGNNGIGKTYDINKLCNDLNLYIININNILSSNELYDIIVKSITSSLYQLLTNNNKKKIIIIDNFDSLFSIDNTINNTLYNLLSKNIFKNIPILCISSIEIIKKIGDIKKKCKIIKLNNPTNSEIFNILTNKYEDIDNILLNNIIEKSNNNISQCIQKIENKINDSIDNKYYVDYLYNNEFDRDILYRLIYGEIWILTLNYHENFICLLKNKKIKKELRNELYKKFLYNFCIFDLIMNHNNIIAVDFFISSIYDIKKIKNNSKNNSILTFTKILSYLSLQKKQNKNNYKNNFPLHQIGNYHINIINRKFIYYN